MSIYKKQAQSLISNGYRIVPIDQGQKGPFIKQWQTKDFTADDIRAGVGVLCGLGDAPVCAIDIDVVDVTLSEAITAACVDLLGPSVERVGQAPKTMVIYQAEAGGWPKVASKWFSFSPWTQDDAGKWVTSGEAQRVEILGKGQQFVAYHIHPGTGAPYEWVDMLGGLEYTPAAELAIITADQVAEIIAMADTLAEAAGVYFKPDSSSRAVSVSRKSIAHDPDNFLIDTSIGLSIKDAGALLKNIDASDYEKWLHIGMALHHEFKGGQDAAELWAKWSESASNYAGADDIANRWHSFGAGGSGVTGRTLVKFGNEANARAERNIKHAILGDYLADIAHCNDIFELTDDVLKRTGAQLDISDVVTIKTIRDAAGAKAKELGYPLTIKEIDAKLGVKRERGIEALERKSLCTEFGNAQRMLLDHKDTIMYVAETDDWYVWAVNVWRKGSRTDIERLAKQTLNGLVQDFDAFGLMSSDELYDFINTSLKASMVSNMIKLVRSEDGIMVPVTELDNNKMLFGCGNGAIDLSTGRLVAADPMDRLTIATTVDYVPSAPCPVWLQTLNDVWFNDQDMIAFFQRLIGYTMLGAPHEDIIVIPYGSGSNGKSTVLGAIRDVFDAHAKTAANDTFMGSQFGGGGGGPREDILRLMGSRFVYVAEPDENSALKEGLVKAMTGGEAMPARAAYARATIEVMPTWVVFMPTNHKPIIKGDDHGIWRRILPIPFDRNFDLDDTVTKDKHRAEKLAAERAGILAWCVQGALQYQSIGLAVPDKIKAARDEYKADMDLLADWLDECTTQGPKEWAGSVELFKSWELFAGTRGELRYIPNSRSLGKRLSSKGYTSFKNQFGYRGRGFRGISLKGGFDNLG